MGRKPKCKYCKRTVDSTSKKGLCPGCQIRKNKVAVKQIIAKNGKYYKKWKQNLINSLK